MSWDCYCAICGGPFTACQFRTIKKQKAPGAKPKALGSSHIQGDANHEIDDAANGDDECEDDDGCGDSEKDIDSEETSESDESEYGFGNEVYDEGIITSEEARWTKTLFVLVCFPNRRTAGRQILTSYPG